MITPKQRAYLRGIANREETIVQIGKEGVTDAVISQAGLALKARELIKLRVLETAMLSPREACDALCAALSAEPVQVIGSRFVIYRRSEQNPKIELPKK